MKEEIRNARIESTFLGIEDHGIFTYVLHLDYGGSGQGFGTYSLGGEYGCESIKGILKVVGVDSWEKLIGKHIRVKFNDEEAGWGNKIEEIGNIIKDEWFSPKEMYKKYIKE